MTDTHLDPVTTEDDGEKEKEVAAWIQDLVKAEVARFKSQGILALPMQVNNMGLVVEDDVTVLNRVEVGTGFDFNTIKQIMLSPPIPCPVKEHFSYVHVLLLKNPRKPVPMVVPYLYDTRKNNDLKDWVFINHKLERTRHRVESFQ